MKTKIIFITILKVFWDIAGFSQDDYWFKKGVDTEDPKEKIEYFTKEIEESGSSFATYINRGVAKGELQDYQGAIADYNKAIELDFDSLKKHYEKSERKTTRGLYSLM
jgi:tetratricopeptide (TPR) repeat protein